MKKTFKILTFLLGIGAFATSYADIGLTAEIVYENHNFTPVNPAEFPIGGEADIKIVVLNTNTAIPANSVWVYLKFPRNDYWRPKKVLTIAPGFVLVDSMASGNETILKFQNNMILPAPATPAPDIYVFKVRGIAAGSSSSYNATGIFTGNNATMEYTNGIINPGVNIPQPSITGLSISAKVNDIPLPVGILNFSGQIKGSTSVLTWNTEYEKNNKGFEIQRSGDSRNFEPLGFLGSLAPGGNSQERLGYSYVDYGPLDGANYYRLKQVDLDGQTHFSEVIRLNYSKGVEGISLYPNPATDKIFISSEKELVKYTIYDAAGRSVDVGVQKLGIGLSELNTSRLAAGTYTVVIAEDAQTVHTLKFSIKR